jgi:hypothetical protein
MTSGCLRQVVEEELWLATVKWVQAFPESTARTSAQWFFQRVQQLVEHQNVETQCCLRQSSQLVRELIATVKHEGNQQFQFCLMELQVLT